MKTRSILAAGLALLLASCGDGALAPPGTPLRSAGPVSRVEVSPSPVSVGVGGTVQLTARAYDANGSEVTGVSPTWSSSAPAVASVSPSGMVSGNSAGSATVYAIVNGVPGSTSVSVTSQDYSVEISGPEYVTSAGPQTWSAVFTGNPGSHYTEWQINPRDDYSEQFYPVDTGDQLTLNVSGCDPDFELRVVVSSQTLGVRQYQTYVFNMAPDFGCW